MLQEAMLVKKHQGDYSYMMRTGERLTCRLREKYLPRLIKEFGFNCIYCKKNLDGEYVFDHLDDTPAHNEYTNIVLACQSCNIKKASNFDLKLLAEDLKKQREHKEDSSPIDEPIESASSERRVNQLLYPFTERIIREKIQANGKYLFSDAVSEAVYLAQKRISCGSEVTIRRYIKQLTCKLGEFEIIKDENGNKYIIQRLMRDCKI